MSSASILLTMSRNWSSCEFVYCQPCGNGLTLSRSEGATRPDDVQSVMNETLSVRSAMRSAIQSQVDPDENLYHAEAEQSLVPPSLSRRGSSQDQNGIPWPDCDIDEDTLFNMQGHQAYDSGPSASAEHHYLAGVEPLASGPQSFGCASYDQPHKRLKLSGEYTDQQMRYFSQFHGPYMPFANPGPDAASGSHDIAVALDPAHITPGQYQCLQCHKTKKRECDLKLVDLSTGQCPRLTRTGNT